MKKVIQAMSNDSLRRAIAEKLGWRVETRTLGYTGDLPWKVLVRPDGKTFIDEDGHLPHEPVHDSGAKDRLFWHCPDWASDANFALDLLENPHITYVEIYCQNKVWCVGLHPRTKEIIYIAHHANKARAICEAWLLWVMEATA